MGPRGTGVLEAIVRHHGALPCSCAYVYPWDSPNARCSGAWLRAWSCARSYSWAEGHQSHIFLWPLPPGISGLTLLPLRLPPLRPSLLPVLHPGSITLPWFCDLVTAPCSCQGPSPCSKTERIKFKSVIHSLLRWKKYLFLAKILVTLSVWKKLNFFKFWKFDHGLSSGVNNYLSLFVQVFIVFWKTSHNVGGNFFSKNLSFDCSNIKMLHS